MHHHESHHEGHHHHESFIKRNNLATPISIVIAGGLIALGIFFSGGSPLGNATPKVQSLETVLSKIAKASGINQKSFDNCLASGKYTQAISDAVGKAGATGGNGTPWTIIVSASGRKYPVSGAQSIDTVKATIEQALKDVGGSSDPALAKMDPVSAADHIKGNANAPVKIVEYSDLECPFCKKFHATLQEAIKAYPDKVAWVFRHFPLAQLHSKAPKEAEAAECAAEIGGNDGFWKFIDKINEVTPSNNKLDQAAI